MNKSVGDMFFNYFFFTQGRFCFAAWSNIMILTSYNSFGHLLKRKEMVNTGAQEYS